MRYKLVANLGTCKCPVITEISVGCFPIGGEGCAKLMAKKLVDSCSVALRWLLLVVHDNGLSYCVDVLAPERCKGRYVTTIEVCATDNESKEDCLEEIIRSDVLVANNKINGSILGGTTFTLINARL